MTEKEPRPKTYVIVPKWTMRLIVVTLLTALISPWGMFVYVNSIDRKQDSDWCELITFYTDYYNNNPPTTPLQTDQRDMMQRRKDSLGCK